MQTDALSAEEFDRLARVHFKGWEARSLNVVRALLVDSQRLSEVASQFGMKPQQAVVLRTRFIKRMNEKAAVKLPASAFMQTVTPSNASPLEPFKKDLRQLVANRYSQEQIQEFLRCNDIQVSDQDLTAFLRGIG